MTRHFIDDPVDPSLLDDLVDLAARAPSAGKTQGWSLLVLEGAEKSRFWDMSLPVERRPDFAWPGLLHAPIVALSFADSDAYVARYGEADKAHTDLGRGVEHWGAPYWTIDASMATMALLLAAHDAGLGALFFAVFNEPDRIREEFGVPESLQLLGAVALGWPEVNSPRSGISASRARATAAQIIHRERW